MRRGWFISIFLVSLMASACSSQGEGQSEGRGESQGEGSTPSVSSTQTPTAQPTEAVEPPSSSSADTAGRDDSQQAEDGDPPGPNRQELVDTFADLVSTDELVTTFITRPEIICLAEGAFAVFTDERLSEIGLNPDSFAEAYRQPGLFVFGDWFDISDREAFDLENLALGCIDWRNFVVQVLVAEGEPMERASCIASQISVDGLRDIVRDAIVVDAGEGFGEAQDEVASAFTTCYLDASPVTAS